ncbi:DUF2986 domain-containing protein [Sansalvadorimonas verongulae]|nr:DUF2986 domain-containing protein [Sansalvadorimonas verongulae]
MNRRKKGNQILKKCARRAKAKLAPKITPRWAAYTAHSSSRDSAGLHGTQVCAPLSYWW